MAETLSVSSMLPNLFEPKRKNQWIFAIEGIDAFLMSKAARPEIEHEEHEIPFVNSRRWVMGVSKLKEMSVTLHDPIAPSGAQQVMEWIRLHFEIVSGRAGYADFYKRDAQIKVLDPIGTVVELWDLKGVWIRNVNFGELSYETGEPQTIELSLRFDLAVLQY